MIREFVAQEVGQMNFERYEYKKVNGQTLSLIISYPEAQNPKGCMIFIHGGGWERETLDRLKPHALYAAQNGAVGVSISYRLLDDAMETDVRDGLEDCIDALEFVRKKCERRYGKIYYTAVGDSAGGYYAACLGCRSIVERVRKGVFGCDFVVDLNGIVDLTGKWNFGIRMKTADILTRQETAYLFSPLYQVCKGDAPVLIVHGDRDETVALSDSESYERTLKKQGVEAELQILSGAKHAFILFDYQHENTYVAERLREVLQYLSYKKMI